MSLPYDSYLITKKSVAYGLCLKSGALIKLLYNEGTVWPG